MYEEFFNLHGRPFSAAPQTHRYFPATVIEGAHKSLTRAIERGEGAGLIVGPPGTGKSLMCHLLAEEFAGRFDVAMLVSGRIATRQALLQAVLYELNLPYRGLDEGELRLMLFDHLQPTSDGKQGLLLLIDEAHTLPWRLLEEVRMMTNFVRDAQPRVRVVLAGSPLLEERFASPKLNSFSQRLAARCYLESLDGNETTNYVRAQVASVGGDPNRLFDEESLRTIYRATDGIPRLINQVCDHALILACLGGLERITSLAIDEAWADLQQLPTPWNAVVKDKAAADNVVEFGGLDDRDLPEAIPFRASRPPLVVRSSDGLLDAMPLEVMDEQFAQINDTIHTLGTISSEVDLDFPEFGDPLGETFQEEEVVLERYRSDVEMFADVPRVSSWEGKQLGSLLEPFGPRQPLQQRSSRSQVSFPRGATPAAGGEDESRDVTPIETAYTAIETARPAIEPSRQAIVAESRREEIVMVDEPTGRAVEPPKPRVRRMEYRQLFAKLRRD